MTVVSWTTVVVDSSQAQAAGTPPRTIKTISDAAAYRMTPTSPVTGPVRLTANRPLTTPYRLASPGPYKMHSARIGPSAGDTLVADPTGGENTVTIAARTVETSRLATYTYTSGPDDGIPVVLVHGNLSTGRFFEPTMQRAPDGLRLIAPDMRGFGRTERVPIDATRGLHDWADDTAALVEALGISQPVHLMGWSTGGAAIAAYALDRPEAVASMTFMDPVSPYGFGSTHGPDGTPNHDDFAGSGGGVGNAEFAERIAAGDRTTDADVSPLNVMRAFYWSPDFHLDPELEQVLLDEILLSVTGVDGYPGDLVPSEHWPGVAPGTRGILNALSGKYCRWAGIVDIQPKPAVLWTHGTADLVVADASPWDMGTLGRMGAVPGWPGDEVFPPQPMVAQIRTVLERYAANGGDVTMEMFEGSGHGPMFDAADRWHSSFFAFLDRVAG